MAGSQGGRREPRCDRSRLQLGVRALADRIHAGVLRRHDPDRAGRGDRRHTGDSREPDRIDSRAGTSFSYYWDFGDGSTASGGDAISHVYDGTGTFVATVTASSSETGSVQATLNIPVRSLTGQWTGDYGRVEIAQDGLDLRGRYLDDPRQGIVEGGVSETGTVTFTITRPGLAPVTFTGTAGPDVMTLVGAENGRDGVDRPWKFTRY